MKCQIEHDYNSHDISLLTSMLDIDARGNLHILGRFSSQILFVLLEYYYLARAAIISRKMRDAF